MTYIIAEIGVNHNGDIKLAEKLILLAKRSGANAVKFQCFKAELLARKKTPKTDYQLKHDLNDRSHYEMLKSLELNREQFKYLRNVADKLSIDFIITPYGLEDLKTIIDLGVDKIKISSADLTDKSLIEGACKSKLPLILSTGMSSIEEIRRTCSTIETYLNVDYSLLHCTSSYPAPYESLNIKAINQLKELCSVIGYSDHSIDGLGSYIAVAMGAEILERHITLDKKMIGPDHHCSDNYDQFCEYIKKIKLIKVSIGNGIKALEKDEENMKSVSRKSAYLKVNSFKGNYLNINDFIFQRPGGGLNEYEIYDLLKKDIKYKKDYKEGEKFNYE